MAKSVNKVINFHVVEDESWFEAVINFLVSKYDMVSINELESYYHDGKTLENACHITIDDGDQTFYDVIYPILVKYNIPATIFVSPFVCKEQKNFWFQEIRGYDELEMKKIISECINIDGISKYSLNSILNNLELKLIWKIIKKYQKRFNIKPKESQNINLDQLVEIDKNALIEIGAHTETHPILANENYEKTYEEIVGSIEGLMSILNHEINWFAYPNGIPNIDFGQKEIDILKAVDCRLAFSTEHKDFTRAHDPLCIPRYGLSYGSQNFIGAKLFLGEYWDELKKIFYNHEVNERIELSRMQTNWNS